MFFLYLVFLSFVGFTVAFLTQGLIVRILGLYSPTSRYAQIFGVPLAVIGYVFLTITTKSFWIGFIPIFITAFLFGYSRFSLWKKSKRQSSRRLRKPPKK